MIFELDAAQSGSSLARSRLTSGLDGSWSCCCKTSASVMPLNTDVVVDDVEPAGSARLSSWDEVVTTCVLDSRKTLNSFAPV